MQQNSEPIHDQATGAIEVSVMSRPRKATVLVLLLGILGGHAYCVMKNDEIWPFSNYPMYSLRQWEIWSNEYLVGTMQGDPSQEIAISYFEYDRPISVKASMRHMSKGVQDDASKAEKLGETMLGLGRIYLDKHAAQSDGSDQAIDTLKLYRVTWEIVDGEFRKETKVIKRELVMEVDLVQGKVIAQEEGV